MACVNNVKNPRITWTIELLLANAQSKNLFLLLKESFESRRLWREVTRGLTVGDIEAATSAKYALEQRQREEALQTKERNINWETKLFHPIGENWFFDDPLVTRSKTD